LTQCTQKERANIYIWGGIKQLRVVYAWRLSAVLL